MNGGLFVIFFIVFMGLILSALGQLHLAADVKRINRQLDDLKRELEEIKGK
jgi:hypothetical protein